MGERPLWEATDPTRRLRTRAQAAKPREVNLPAAQPDVNFVVFAPGSLPRGCSLGPTLLRPEQPPGRPDGCDAAQLGQTPWSEANPCSLRTIVAGDGRALRIKQFLYDWAPPAAGIAPLWDSPWLEPFTAGDAVGWLGEDYRDALGGCIELAGTQIELSVLDGALSRDELRLVLKSLRVAEPVSAEVVQRAPFHERNYWVRYRMRPYKTPHGLWRHRRPRPYAHATPADPVAHTSLPLLAPDSGRFALTSRLTMRVDGGHEEVESIFGSPDAPDDRLWLVAARIPPEQGLAVPPELDERAAAVARREPLTSRTVWIAGLTPRYGAWEARWEEAGARYALWSNPSPHRDLDAFLQLLDGLAPERAGHHVA